MLAQDSPRSVNERATRQKVISCQRSVHASYSSDPGFNDDNDTERRDVSNRKPSSAGAVKAPEAALLFARGLYGFLHGRGQLEKKFERWCEVVGGVTAEADAGFDLAGGNGVRIYREPGDVNIFEAERHAGSRQGIWI